ncbi:MAG: hypothetical protein DPW16_07485 [Chloroflexi bacterium]|nr:hypothetical protein [Chloroflexota bacterium]
MDIKEQLLAYLEGTLTPAQRREVVRRLAISHQWQAELEAIQYSQSQLKREMPAFGCPTHKQLTALLPDILEKSKQPSRLREKMDWAQGGMLLCMVAVILMMVPILIKAQTAVLASTNLKNIPATTNTPVAIRVSTLEVPRAVVASSNGANVVEAVVYRIQADFQYCDLRTGLFLPISPRTRSDVRAVGLTPAPVPGSTLEPSREAALETRQ